MVPFHPAADVLLQRDPSQHRVQDVAAQCAPLLFCCAAYQFSLFRPAAYQEGGSPRLCHGRFALVDASILHIC